MEEFDTYRPWVDVEESQEADYDFPYDNSEDDGVNGGINDGVNAVSYTHLTLPTILRV